MENQDLDLLGQTVGNLPYKLGIIDQNGNLKNQFVANASTNRIDIPEQFLSGGGSTGGGTAGGNAGGGTAPSQVTQLPSALNLFSGSAVGNILLSGPSANYDNVQDGLLLTLASESLPAYNDPTSGRWMNYGVPSGGSKVRFDIYTIGLSQIKIPKEKLIANSSIDISDQLSQYIGKTIQAEYYKDADATWLPLGQNNYSVASFGGTTINVLPNTTLSISLTVKVQSEVEFTKNVDPDIIQIPVIQVNDYKN